MRPCTQRFVGGLAPGVRSLFPIASHVENADRVGSNMATPNEFDLAVESNQCGADFPPPQRHVRPLLPQHYRP